MATRNFVHRHLGFLNSQSAIEEMTGGCLNAPEHRHNGFAIQFGRGERQLVRPPSYADGMECVVVGCVLVPGLQAVYEFSVLLVHSLDRTE